MQEEPPICFSGFRIDPANECLWRGHQVVRLRTKAFAVLRYLAEHPGSLLIRNEVMHAVWPGISVSDASLTVCIKEIRHALGDDPRAPQYVETVRGRGYRFIAPLTTPLRQGSGVGGQGSVRESQNKVERLSAYAAFPPIPEPRSASPVLVGRETELAQLHAWLDKALRGERQVVFVTGEPGIGKTSVVEVFTEQLGTTGEWWIGQGQCIDHYGAGEGYLPVLVAVEHLWREPGARDACERSLRKRLPTWLVQMPALLTAPELEACSAGPRGLPGSGCCGRWREPWKR